MSLNRAMLIGHVGANPEVRYVGAAGSQNSKVAQFRLATTERYKDRDGNVKENTEWHNIVAWRGLADLAEKYIVKGTQLYIEGKIRTRSWEDKQGNKRYTTEILAEKIDLLGKPSSEQKPQQAPVQQKPQQHQTTAMPYPTETDDSDLPFN